MKQEIIIDIQNGTCDISIRGLPLNRISSLSTIGYAVADNLKANLILLGANPGKAAEGVSLLLQGTHGIEYIVKAVLRAEQSLNN